MQTHHPSQNYIFSQFSCDGCTAAGRAPWHEEFGLTILLDELEDGGDVDEETAWIDDEKK